MDSLPNILLVICDQQRAPMPWEEDWLNAHLPAMARLRRNGMTFTRAFCNTCACSPSRASLFTGLYPASHGVTQSLFHPDQQGLPQDLPNLAHYMGENGYQTVLKGKWHLQQPLPKQQRADQNMQQLSQEMEQKWGFRQWDPPDAGGPGGPETYGAGTGNHDARYLRDAQTFLEQYRGDKPFCLIVSLVNPHDVMAYPGKGLADFEQAGFRDELFAHLDIPLPPTLQASLQRKPTVQRSMLAECNRRFGDLNSLQEQAAYVRFYAGLQMAVDAQVNALLDTLDACGLQENTLVVRTADHGEMAMSHGGQRQKFFNAYEETIRVPLIFSNPKLFPKALECHALVSLVDLLPTFAALSGGTQATHLPGLDLTPLLRDPSRRERDYVHFTFDDCTFPVSGPNQLRTLREQHWKYSLYFNHEGQTEYELYHLAQDPLEEMNLLHAAPPSAEIRVQAERLHRRLITVMQTLGTTPDVPLPDSPHSLKHQSLENPTQIWLCVLDIAQLFTASTLLRRLKQQLPAAFHFTLLVRFPDFEKLLAPELDARTRVLVHPMDTDIPAALQVDQPQILLVFGNAVPQLLVARCQEWSCAVYWLGAECNKGDLTWADTAQFRSLKHSFQRIYLSEQAHLQNLAGIGFPTEQMQVTGALKAECAEPGKQAQAIAWECLEQAGFRPGQPLLFGSSIWPGEAEVLCRSLAALRAFDPSWGLIIAPRCREHYQQIANAIRDAGFSLARRSLPSQPGKEAGCDVFLLDSEGELRNYLIWSRLVFVGRSLTHRVGSSLFEAAAAERPMIVGPNMGHFEAPLAWFMQHKALVQVADESQLLQQVTALSQNLQEQRLLGSRALAALKELGGAMGATLDHLLQQPVFSHPYRYSRNS